ncbi:hypothetical protein [Polaribacter sargassicola]|nr:hypothetical protein [Polaribacter sp. DS7-9]MCG1036457.1 hypothetical protein [Polaribacter sp. DS7-9]
MKKVTFIAICILGIISFSSCRSTSNPCGLADNTTTTQTTLKQVDLI